MKKQLTLSVDTQRCMGCRACETACKQEHKLSAGPRYTVVAEVEHTSPAADQLLYHHTHCHHCDHAPCIASCPASAITKRPDGIVLVDGGLCTGCGICLTACPYDVPQFGDSGKMEKCDLCAHRLDEGELPACVTACPTEAILVGSGEEISAILDNRYPK